MNQNFFLNQKIFNDRNFYPEISNPEISNFSSRLFHKASKCLENPSYLQVRLCEHKLPKISHRKSATETETDSKNFLPPKLKTETN